MSEKETISDFDIEILNPLLIDQQVNLRNRDGDIVIRHKIFHIDTRAFLSFFNEDTEELEDKYHHMFGSVMGYPDTASVANIPEYFKDGEERFELCCLAEEKFYNQYFEKDKEEDGYLRYIHDFVFDNWNEENMSRMISHLQEKGFLVTMKLEGRTSVDVYHAVLLFEKRDKDFSIIS